jgi:transposase
MREHLRTWRDGTPVVLEATFGWGWLADELLAAGLDPHLASSRKVAGWRRARGKAKSNRTDADLLSELWDQQPRWWEVWLAPPEVRDRREWLRFRMALVTMQSGLKCRIHAVLHRHGIFHDFSDLFGTGGRAFLNSLVTPNDETLRKSAKATLKGYLQLLDHSRRQMARVTHEFRRQIVKNPDGERLCTIPGISWILGYTILAEVGDIRRFRSAKHLASYSLLVPQAYDSGEADNEEDPKGRHVGRVGRITLKTAWVQAAHATVRRGGRFRRIFDPHTDGGKRNRGRGYIAVAHELCRVGYAVWTKEADCTDTPPARPGRRSKRRSSRPGTGQPVGLMVAAAC